jgi:hypothetical protein
MRPTITLAKTSAHYLYTGQTYPLTLRSTGDHTALLAILAVAAREYQGTTSSGLPPDQPNFRLKQQ